MYVRVEQAYPHSHFFFSPSLSLNHLFFVLCLHPTPLPWKNKQANNRERQTERIRITKKNVIIQIHAVIILFQCPPPPLLLLLLLLLLLSLHIPEERKKNNTLNQGFNLTHKKTKTEDTYQHVHDYFA